jgi:hypothetical protein
VVIQMPMAIYKLNECVIVSLLTEKIIPETPREN